MNYRKKVGISFLIVFISLIMAFFEKVTGCSLQKFWETSLLCFLTACLIVSILFGVSLMLSAFRLFLVYKYLDLGISYRETFSSFLAGQVAGLLFLPFLTSIVTHALKLKNKNHFIGTTVTAYLLERLIVAGTGFILASASFFLIIKADFLSNYLKDCQDLVLIGVSLFFILLFSIKDNFSLIKNMVSKRFFKYLLLISLVSLISWGITSSIFLVLLFFLNNDFSLTITSVAASLIVSFLASLPLSPNGWGIRELSSIYFFGIIGVAPQNSISISVTVGVLAVINILIIFYFIKPGDVYWVRNKTLKQVL